MQIDQVRDALDVSLLERVYLGNPVRVWLIAALVFVVALTALVFVRWLLIRQFSRRAEQTETKLDDYLLALLQHTRYSFLGIMALAPALRMLMLPARVPTITVPLLRLVLIIQIGLWLGELVTLYIHDLTIKRTARDVSSVTTIRAMGLMAQMILWVVVALLALRNFGVDVTALLTTLGVAGIAAALAVQKILGDLLASLSIVLDKPFVVGDYIAVDGFEGTVEEIGIKTTRVRGLTGEQIVFSNSNLLDSRIRNYKTLRQRRISFKLGFEYGTSQAALEQIPSVIREIIESIEHTRFDRSHFASYGDWSLVFETVYYVTVPDYGSYMDIQQRINLALNERMTKLGAGFAFPTEVVIMDNGAGKGDAGGGDPTPALTSAPA